MPAGRPALVIVVMVDEPRGAKFHGGDVAAPVFSRIAQPMLMYLKVPPDHEDPLVFDRSLQASVAADDDAAPGDDADPGAARRPQRVHAAAAGLVVAAVSRNRGSAASSDRDDETGAVHASIVGLAARLLARADGGAEVMPDLVGLSLRQANETLASRGLICRNDKRGLRVTRQDPDPGVSVAPRSSCLVTY